MADIAGELCVDGRADAKTVERILAHRHGHESARAEVWASGRVALGHRAEGSAAERRERPGIFDADLGLALVYDGHIDNYDSIRAQLASHHTFRTPSDAELVLTAYAHWGEEFVDHLVGAFAAVIVDERRSLTILVRDRLGIKPLYTAQSGTTLRFASTLPALLRAGDVDVTLDPIAIHHYLSWHSIVPAPRTILRGVRKLPAATIRVVEADGRVRDRVYWTVDYERDERASTWGRDEWVDALHHSLREAVERAVVPQASVGVLLSGGLDSSLLVALLDELGVRDIPTFSIGFDDVGQTSGNEFEYSDLVSRHFGTDHHRFHIPGSELARAVPEVVRSMSEPMASHDAAGFYLLSREVAKHVPRVLSGQGADELFAGYGYHQSLVDVGRDAALAVFSSSFRDRSHDAVQRIVNEKYATDADVSAEFLAEWLHEGAGETAIDAVLRLDTHALMVDDPVKRVDNMTSAWGLDARMPFLDPDVVALAAKCPPELKIEQGGKGVLKELGRRLLPADVVDRPKGYFPVPAFRELTGEALGLARATMTSEVSRHRGLFTNSFITDLVKRPHSHAAAGANPLWSITVLELWLQEHGID